METRPNPANMIAARSLSKRFGGLLAVSDANLVVRRGSITGLIGPNGAGKTTLFSLLAGSLRASSGDIWIDGKVATHSPAHQRVALGLGRTFQIPRPFAEMSVLENLLASFQNHPGERILGALWSRRSKAVEADNLARAHELLTFVTLAPLAEQPAKVLSGGQRKLLELARVLAAGPQVILLDEPAAGVNPTLLETILERIQTLNAQGISFLLTEHNMDVVTRLCHHVYAMARGQMLCDGTVDEVTQNPVLLDAYLGG